MTSEAAVSTATTTAAPATMGDAANQSTQQTGAAAAVPFNTAPAETGAPDFKTSLGEYAKDPMFADFDDPQKLAKSYAETKRLVGQKLGIPAADATPEAKAAFYEQLGVPKEAAGYGLGVPDGMPEDMAEKYKSDYLPAFLERGKRLNLTKDQLTALQQEEHASYMKIINEAKVDVEKSQAEFEKVTKEIFGDNVKEEVAKVDAILMTYVPEKLVNEFSTMSPAQLAAVAAAFSGYVKKNGISENKDISKNNGSNTVALTGNEARNEARRLMATPAYLDPFHADHKDTKAKIDALYKTM